MVVVEGRCHLGEAVARTGETPGQVVLPGRQDRCSSWKQAVLAALRSASPWRTFRWYKGQKHYSGAFWSATEHDWVIYESRLELACLLFADF